MEIPLSSFYDKANYQLQYIDYDKGTWTMPCLLYEG